VRNKVLKIFYYVYLKNEIKLKDPFSTKKKKRLKIFDAEKRA
jgi:hypothetical protein